MSMEIDALSIEAQETIRYLDTYTGDAPTDDSMLACLIDERKRIDALLRILDSYIARLTPSQPH